MSLSVQDTEMAVTTPDLEPSVTSLASDVPEAGKSSVFGAAVNMFNSIIGVGIVTLPLALKQSGAYAGFLVACLGKGLGYYTSILMIKGKYKGKNITTYGEYCRQGIGEIGFYFQTFACFCMMLGIMIPYCILFRLLITDTISDLMAKQFEYGRWILLGVAVTVMLPLSLIKDISKLSRFSVISLVGVAAILVTVFARAPVYHNEMTALTPQKMKQTAQGLDLDFAIWICHEAAHDHNPYEGHLPSWTGPPAIDYKPLFSNLKGSKACSRPVSVEGVYQKISEVEVGNATQTRDSMKDAFAEHLYNHYSLNEEGAEVRDFSLHQFIRGGILVAFGVFSSAFLAQQAVFGIYQSLKVQTLRNWHLTLQISFGAAFSASMACAMVGYFCFQYQAGDFVFTTMVSRYYGLDVDYVANFGRLCLLLTIVLTYPMMLYYCRINVILFFVKLLAACGWIYDEKSNLHFRVSFYGCGVGIWFFTVIIGMFVDDVYFVFSLVGALFAAPLIYILPVVAWFGLEGGMVKVVKEAYAESTSKFLHDCVVPFGTIAFGTVAMVASTVSALLQQTGVTNY